MPHKEAIEKHLRGRVGELFAPSQELLIYDVTSTYFEGQCAKNPQAKRGHSRDHRPDCLQVCIGLVVTEEGLPLGYEVFAGNRHDSTTLKTIVETMERKYGKSKRIWVLDRGIVSEENLRMLRERNGRYIVGTPKARHWRNGCPVKRAWVTRPRGLLDEFAKIRSGDVGAADQKCRRHTWARGASPLRDGAGRRPESAAATPRPASASPAASAIAAGRNVVKTFAKNRRKSLFDGRYLIE